MKKVLFIICVFLSMNLIAQEAPNVNVYVCGISSDGIDMEYAYWKNGVMHSIAPVGKYGLLKSFDVENGDVYCAYEELNKQIRSIQIYQNNKWIDMYNPCAYNSRLDVHLVCMRVMNGNIFLGVNEREANSSGCYKLVKLKPTTHDKSSTTSAGDNIAIDYGTIYFTACNQYAENKGYSVGGQRYYNPEAYINYVFHVNKMRVLNGNVYMIGYDSNGGACIQTNDQYRNYIRGYGKDCADFIAIGNKSFWLMCDEHKPTKIISSDGDDILRETSYKPLQIEEKGGMLYILAEKRQGSQDFKCVLTYNPTTKSITSNKILPQCTTAMQMVVVEEY